MEEYKADKLYHPEAINNDVFIVTIPRMYTNNDKDKALDAVPVSNKHFGNNDEELREHVEVGLTIPQLAELAVAGVNIKMERTENKIIVYDIIMQHVDQIVNRPVHSIHDTIIDEDNTDTLLMFARLIYEANFLEFREILGKRVADYKSSKRSLKGNKRRMRTNDVVKDYALGDLDKKNVIIDVPMGTIANYNIDF